MAANTQGKDGEEVIFDIIRESIIWNSRNLKVVKKTGL